MELRRVIMVNIVFFIVAARLVAALTLGADMAQKQPKWLAPSCRLSVIADQQVRNVAVDCGCGKFIIIKPDNLAGHVSIKSPADALAYVRFFTSPDSYRYFDVDSSVEVRPVPDERSRTSFNAVPRKLFDAAGLSDATAKEFTYGDVFGYLVTRCVVRHDQRIYLVNEFVRPNGAYRVLSEHVLLNNAADIGILHIGDI
jgi:hypothetical protein